MHGVVGSGEGDLALEEVLAGLDEEDVDAAFDEGLALLHVGAEHGVVSDVAERGELGSGANGAGDEAGAVGSGEFIGYGAGELGGGKVQLAGALRDAELAQDEGGGPEGIRFDDVGAGGEVAAMDGGDDVRARDGEDLGAVLHLEIVVEGKIVALDGGSHGTVVDDDALGEEVEEGGHK